MTRTVDRRQFLEHSARLAAGLALASCVRPQTSITSGDPWFQISLAEWSFHKAIFARQMDHLDFAKVAKTDFGISAVEYVMAVIVENHGGLSSNGQWLAGVMKKVNLPNCGTLPDFGNFDIGGGQQYDRYKGVGELMPFAKAVSAKSHDFDDAGNETRTDYRRMMKIVKDAGYRSFVGIEYEGDKLAEGDGVRATKALLEKGPSRAGLKAPVPESPPPATPAERKDTGVGPVPRHLRGPGARGGAARGRAALRRLPV